MNPERRIYCNRTLNMRSIRAIGYDMDYTLVHYHVEEWERRAYDFHKERLLARGWPVKDLSFDPALVCRGLVVDLEKGNLVKANRFGFIKRAMHGTRALNFDEQREAYSRTIVDLSEDRWIFLNTLFSLSEGCLYAQVVDLLDRKLVPETLGYRDLYRQLKAEVDGAHMEGRLKAEIIADPERFVILDPETPLALLDEHHAGKKLLLITNSEWTYTSAMMSYSFDRFLPSKMSWRALFDVVIVGARKPEFFTTRSPLFEVATEDGLLKPATKRMSVGQAYLGGSARDVESHLGLSGDEILYVGDHMFGDVHVTKNVLRWRTALILRELEEEIAAITTFQDREAKLAELMEKKETLEAELCEVRLALQRMRQAYGPPSPEGGTEASLQKRVEEIRAAHARLDEQVGPLAKASAELSNPTWGLLMRAGNDKSHLAYQVERYADIYTSRVSNLAKATPFVYLRSTRGSLPHDAGGSKST